MINEVYEYLICNIIQQHFVGAARLGLEAHQSVVCAQCCVVLCLMYCSHFELVSAVTRGAWGQCCVLHGILSIITTLQEAAAGDISWLQQVRPVCRMYQHRVHWPALRVSSWCHAEWSPGVLAHHERVKHHRLRQHDSVQPLRHWWHGQSPLQDAGPGQWPVPSEDHHLVMPHKFPVNVVGVIKKSYYWLFIAGRFHYEHLHCDRIRHGSFHLPQCNQRV